MAHTVLIAAAVTKRSYISNSKFLCGSQYPKFLPKG